MRRGGVNADEKQAGALHHVHAASGHEGMPGVIGRPVVVPRDDGEPLGALQRCEDVQEERELLVTPAVRQVPSHHHLVDVCLLQRLQECTGGGLLLPAQPEVQVREVGQRLCPHA